MPARLTLICHATTEAVHLGRFPTDEDIDSAAAAALADVAPPKAGYWLSAPELRARRTAVLLLGREPQVEAGLRDWDLGAWGGRTMEDVAETGSAAFARWLADPSEAPHNGESLEVLFARVAGFMATAAQRGGRIATVTHPAVVRAAIATALGAGASAFWRIDAAPLARARLSHDGRRWVLQGLVPPGV